MNIEEILKTLNALQTVAGDLLLSDTVAWLQVEENAQKLLAEGHENDQS